jgi:hypothetical protein
VTKHLSTISITLKKSSAVIRKTQKRTDLMDICWKLPLLCEKDLKAFPHASLLPNLDHDQDPASQIQTHEIPRKLLLTGVLNAASSLSPHSMQEKQGPMNPPPSLLFQRFTDVMSPARQDGLRN